jgi:hypothetical protein
MNSVLQIHDEVFEDIKKSNILIKKLQKQIQANNKIICNKNTNEAAKYFYMIQQEKIQNKINWIKERENYANYHITLYFAEQQNIKNVTSISRKKSYSNMIRSNYITNMAILHDTYKGEKKDYINKNVKHYNHQPRQCTICGGFNIKVRSEINSVCKTCGHVEDNFIEDYYIVTEVINNSLSTGRNQKVTNFSVSFDRLIGNRPPRISAANIEKIQEYICNMHGDTKSYMKYKPAQIRKCMKSLNLAEFYPDIPHIYATFHNNSPPNVNEDEREKIIDIFINAFQAWKDIKSDDCKNITVKFFLRKIIELRNLEYFYKFLPYPKDPQKLYKYDEDWKKICKIIHQPVISSR